MPFVYSYGSGAAGTNLTTSATPNTEVDNAYISTGTGANIALAYGLGIYVGGKSAGLTVISGIGFRVKKWTSTASSGGTTGLTPKDVGDQALSSAQVNCGFGSPVTSGTGGPTYIGGFTCGATGPGGWVMPNANSLLKNANAANTCSLDLFSSSGTPSLPFEATIEVQGLIP